ncbi:MAG: hypothetical protein Q9218_006911 [Villophora microphyllina]
MAILIKIRQPDPLHVELLRLGQPLGTRMMEIVRTKTGNPIILHWSDGDPNDRPITGDATMFWLEGSGKEWIPIDKTSGRIQGHTSVYLTMNDAMATSNQQEKNNKKMRDDAANWKKEHAIQYQVSGGYDPWMPPFLFFTKNDLGPLDENPDITWVLVEDTELHQTTGEQRNIYKAFRVCSGLYDPSVSPRLAMENKVPEVAAKGREWMRRICGGKPCEAHSTQGAVSQLPDGLEDAAQDLATQANIRRGNVGQSSSVQAQASQTSGTPLITSQANAAQASATQGGISQTNGNLANGHRANDSRASGNHQNDGAPHTNQTNTTQEGAGQTDGNQAIMPPPRQVAIAPMLPPDSRSANPSKKRKEHPVNDVDQPPSPLKKPKHTIIDTTSNAPRTNTPNVQGPQYPPPAATSAAELVKTKKRRAASEDHLEPPSPPKKAKTSVIGPESANTTAGTHDNPQSQSPDTPSRPVLTDPTPSTKQKIVAMKKPKTSIIGPDPPILQLAVFQLLKSKPSSEAPSRQRNPRAPIPPSPQEP